MNYSDFYFMINEEIKAMLFNPRGMKRIVEDRKKFSITIVKNGTVEILIKDNAMKYAKENDIPLLSDIKEKVDEIIGITGSSGCAVGRVRIIHGYKEISKLKKGDVLVTTMTTPDYVVAMKKAAAVVTDEGGLTCYAAIVSRELGIPCIIGTNISTKVLKDGDFIEVDANKGIVRRLRK